ncbi:MAG: DNA repair protein RadC [Candidatus Azobacteroides sp.]|nr:DNA repair protein RadC [Candidatus Azobacteroides sp.]
MEEYKKLNISDWAEEDRPREKLMAKGVVSLSDAELLAILIGSGNRDETAVELCQRILQCNENDLNKLAKRSPEDLCKYKGIGEAKAISIIAALEIGRRRRHDLAVQKKKIIGGKDVYEYFHPIVNDLPYEELWVLMLDRGRQIIDKKKISQGGVSETVADIRLVMKAAIESLASNIILCHNHPSGQVLPSTQDDILTKKLRDAGRIMNINLADHVIIAENLFFSYAEEGRI